MDLQFGNLWQSRMHRLEAGKSWHNPDEKHSLPVSYRLSELSFLASCVISKVHSCSQWGRGKSSRSMPLYRLGVSSF